MGKYGGRLGLHNNMQSGKKKKQSHTPKLVILELSGF